MTDARWTMSSEMIEPGFIDQNLSSKRDVSADLEERLVVEPWEKRCGMFFGHAKKGGMISFLARDMNGKREVPVPVIVSFDEKDFFKDAGGRAISSIVLEHDFDGDKYGVAFVAKESSGGGVSCGIRLDGKLVARVALGGGGNVVGLSGMRFDFLYKNYKYDSCALLCGVKPAGRSGESGLVLESRRSDNRGVNFKYFGGGDVEKYWNGHWEDGSAEHGGHLPHSPVKKGLFFFRNAAFKDPGFSRQKDDARHCEDMGQSGGTEYVAVYIPDGHTSGGHGDAIEIPGSSFLGGSLDLHDPAETSDRD